MAFVDTKNLSSFAQSALSLDSDFAELDRLSAEIEHLAIDSDNGLDRAQRLLAKFAECGQRIGDQVPVLAKALDEARARAEKAAALVSERATVVQARQEKVAQLNQRFEALGEMVKKISSAVAQLRKPAGGVLSDEEKSLLAQHLPQLNTQLGMLVEEAQKLRNDAHAANMKGLEKNADSMAQSLQSVRRKLNAIVDQSTEADGPRIADLDAS